VVSDKPLHVADSGVEEKARNMTDMASTARRRDRKAPSRCGVTRIPRGRQSHQANPQWLAAFFMDNLGHR